MQFHANALNALLMSIMLLAIIWIVHALWVRDKDFFFTLLYHMIL